MPPTSPPGLPGWLPVVRIVALCLLVFSVWASVHDKWTPASFNRPIGYALDSLFMSALIKAGSESDWVPLLSKDLPRLGAPSVANWNDFPVSEDHVFFFWGQVARLTGVIAAQNLAYLTAALAAAVSLYLVARWLRLRWEAAFLAGALFGVSPFLFYRGVNHLTLVNYWHLPLLVPVALWLGGRRGLAFSSRRFKLALGIAVLAGIYDVYYLNYALQILGLGVLAQLFRRRWRAAAVGSVVIAAALAAFLVSNLDTVISRVKLGPNPSAVYRNPADGEIYGLRPIELFIPGPRHHDEAFARVAERHRAAALAIGEFPSMYLGIIGGAALLWLLVITMRALLLREGPGWGRFGLFSVWLIFVGVPGGLMKVFQTVTGQVLFRSNNRVSILLMMFALLFFARLLSALPKRIPRAAQLSLIALLLGWGIYDQTPCSRVDANAPHWETVRQREQIAVADERLVAEVEKRLPKGALVFQLPAIPFPEAGYVNRVPDYDQLRPYLFSSSLRFSYGNIKGRPEASWQHEVAAMPAEERAAELQRRGFAAIYVLRNGYQPEEVEELIASMRELGHTELIESEYGDSFFLLLEKPQG